MRRKTLFTLFLVLCSIPFLFCAQNRTKITVLPFINNGSIEYEKLSDYIPSYIILLLKDLPGYAATPLFDVKQYMSKNKQNPNDLKNQAVIASLARDLGSDIMICGYFDDDGGQVFVSFTIYKINGQTMSLDNKIVRVDLGKTDIFTLNASFDRFVPLVKEITRIDLEPGMLTVTADYECSLYVDDYLCGDTPIRLQLNPGMHTIQLTHTAGDKEEPVTSETLSIVKGSAVSRTIEVFTPLSIKAEEKCTVFVNGEEKGPTPFEELLYTGREYLVRVMYYTPDGTSIEVYNDLVSTKKPLQPMYFSSKATLSIDCPPPFEGSVGLQEQRALPFKFTDIVPGKYRMRVVLPRDGKDSNWVFYDETVTIAPFSRLPLAFGTFDYKKNIGLALVPSASQFYNREPVKGGIMLASFLSAAALAGISLWQWSYHDSEYDRLWEQRMSPPPGWTDAINGHDSSRGLFLALAITGSAIAGIMYSYSLIDGFATMDEIYGRIHPGSK